MLWFITENHFEKCSSCSEVNSSLNLKWACSPTLRQNKCITIVLEQEFQKIRLLCRLIKWKLRTIFTSSSEKHTRTPHYLKAYLIFCFLLAKKTYLWEILDSISIIKELQIFFFFFFFQLPFFYNIKIDMISPGYLKIDYDGIEVDNKIKGINKTKEAYFLHVFPFYCAPKQVVLVKFCWFHNTTPSLTDQSLLFDFCSSLKFLCFICISAPKF